MDNSWDNSHLPSTDRNGFKWNNILISLAIALLLIGVFSGGLLWLSTNRNKVRVWEIEHAEADWLAARRVVESLLTDDGAVALYRNNSKLTDRFQTDQDFMQAVRRWRSSLAPLPEFPPSVESKRLDHRSGFTNGIAVIAYKMGNGSRLIIFWDGPSVKSSRQLTDIDVVPR